MRITGTSSAVTGRLKGKVSEWVGSSGSIAIGPFCTCNSLRRRKTTGISSRSPVTSFMSSRLSRLDIKDVTGDLELMPVVLRRRSELQVQNGPIAIDPDEPTHSDTLPLRRPVTADDVPVILMSQG